MNIMHSIADLLAITAQHWSGSIQRHQAPPKPRYGSVKRHRRHADKQRARRRARRLNHY